MRLIPVRHFGLTRVIQIEQLCGPYWMQNVYCLHTAGSMVLRVAILYGFVESPSESAVTTLLSSVIASDVACPVDHVQRRFPTHCADVAVVIRQLLEKRIQVWFYFALFLLFLGCAFASRVPSIAEQQHLKHCHLLIACNIVFCASNNCWLWTLENWVMALTVLKSI